LGKFGTVLQWKMLAYFMAIWSILKQFGKFYGLMVCFVAFWYIFSRFGKLNQEKSGNPGLFS
jgi:putative copper export protein